MEETLTPEQDRENALSQIRSYAIDNRLSAEQVRRIFTAGIAARDILNATTETAELETELAA
jgi:hypothetical protein